MGILAIVLISALFTASYVGMASAEGKKYAVVIGVENYQKMGKKDYAKNDAKDMATHLTNNGWEVTKLEDATRDQIESALMELAKANPEDQVLIYFSGHTGQLENGDEEYDEVLCPTDVDPNNYEETGITDDDLMVYLLPISSKHIAVVMETCDAGGYFETAKEGGCVELGACKEGQKGWYWSELGDGHGVYTYFLLEELKKGLSIEKAHENAAKKTTDYVRDVMKKGLQEPDIKDNYEGEYIVAKIGGVGGVWVPIDKLGLLAPYIGVVSTILVATAATAIYTKRVKRRKEKQ